MSTIDLKKDLVFKTFPEVRFRGNRAEWSRTHRAEVLGPRGWEPHPNTCHISREMYAEELVDRGLAEQVGPRHYRLK